MYFNSVKISITIQGVLNSVMKNTEVKDVANVNGIRSQGNII